MRIALASVALLGLALAWFARRSPTTPVPVAAKYGGLKTADASRSGPAPGVAIIVPTGKEPVSAGEPFDCVIRLTILPGARMPTLLNVKVQYKGVICADLIPDPYPIGEGVFECRGRFEGLKARGKYRLEAECVDVSPRGSLPPRRVVTASASTMFEVR